MKGGGSHAETAQSAQVILKLVLWWSDQHLLDCFRYNDSSVLGPVCAHVLEASSRGCSSLGHVPLVWSSHTWCRVQYLQDSSQDVAQNIIIALEKELKVLGYVY